MRSRQRIRSAIAVRLGALAAADLVVVGGCGATRPAVGAAVLADGEQLALAAAWAAALVLAAWHLAGVIACAAAVARPDVALVRSLARVAPSVVRRSAGLACSASLLAAPLAAGPARAAAGATGDEPVIRAPATAPLRPTTTVAATTIPATTTSSPATAPHRASTAPDPATDAVQPLAGAGDGASRAPGTHVVAPGDNLWVIAARHLAATRAEAPARAEVARYWHAVIDANRATLRSGDPSLIFPGEVVALPPTTG